jgi:two-component system, NarL family, response regulator DevR
MQTITARPANGLRVYLVEDSDVVRTRLERLLGLIPGVRMIGHASTAHDAIRDIHAKHPDLVLLDLGLAEGSGFDVLSGVAGMEPSPEIYLMSSFAPEPYRGLARRLGAKDCFDKTNDFERVRDLVAERAAHLAH